MKKLRWQIFIVAITLLVVAGLLQLQQPGQTVFVPQPTSGGIFTEGLVGGMSRLNPLLDVNNTADRDVNRFIFSGLIKFDTRGMPQADLAASWGVTSDGTKYNFSIRPNAVWHDGTPVTSDDVIFTIALIKNNASFFAADIVSMWQAIEVVRLDDKTVQFKLPEPFAPFLDYLTFGLLPKHLLESVPPEQIINADFNLNPIGTGAYSFDHFIVENNQVAGVVLTRFEDYYLSAPYIDQIVFRYYPTPAAAYDAYRQGQVLSISNITPDILPQALVEPNLSIHTGRMPQMSLVLLNLNDPSVSFLQNAKVRRALLLGTNRQSIINHLLGGQGIIANSPIFPGTWAYNDSVEQLSYDPEAAITLLKAEGYVIPASGGSIRAKDNVTLSLTLSHPDDAFHSALAALIQKDWAKLGVQAILEPLPYDSLVNGKLNTRQFQAALVDLNLSRSPDPDPYPFWHQSEATGGQNYSQWDNRSASEYLEQARTTADINIRARLYRNFQVVFSKEIPSILLYYPVYSYGVSSQVYGVQMPPLFDFSDRFLTINDWYLVTRRSREVETTTP